jgi:hypothetical protein
MKAGRKVLQQKVEMLTEEGEVGEGEQVEQQKPEEFACRSSRHLLTACKGCNQAGNAYRATSPCK